MVRRIMHALKISEISAVDRPAQAHAKMTIMKRNEGRTNMDIDAKEDLLARREGARQTLITSIESILDNPNFNTEEANNQLLDTVRTWLVFTGSVSGEFGGSRSGPGAPKAPTMAGSQSPDIVIADLIKSATEGPGEISKGLIRGIAKIYSARDRQPTESAETALGRFWESHPDFRRAYALAPDHID